MKKRLTKIEQLAEIRRSKEQQLTSVHDAGAKRHPQVWFEANRAAVNAMWACEMNPEDLDNKLAVSTIVLRVLDATQNCQSICRAQVAK